MSHSPLILDLALLYRVLAAGADGDLDPTELDAMRAALLAWAPGEDPSRVDHVLREVALFDVGTLGFGEILERIAAQLDSPARSRVLADLRRIAKADGRVTQGEEGMLSLVERALGGAA